MTIYNNFSSREAYLAGIEEINRGQNSHEIKTSLPFEFVDFEKVVHVPQSLVEPKWSGLLVERKCPNPKCVKLDELIPVKNEFIPVKNEKKKTYSMRGECAKARCLEPGCNTLLQ